MAPLLHMHLSTYVHLAGMRISRFTVPFPVVSLIYFCIKNWGAKATHICHLTISVCPKSRNDLAGWFWLGISLEILTQMPAQAVVTWSLDREAFNVLTSNNNILLHKELRFFCFNDSDFCLMCFSYFVSSYVCVCVLCFFSLMILERVVFTSLSFGGFGFEFEISGP